MAEKYPSMPLMYKELEADEAVKLMTPAQFGCYIRLLISCWHEGSLPSELSKVESLSTYKGKHFRTSIWTCMKDKFPKKHDGRLHNKMVDEKRLEISEKKKKQSEAGKKTAEKRWHSNDEANSLPINLAIPTEKLSGNNHHQNQHQNQKESILSKLGPEKIKELKTHLEETFRVRGWILNGLAEKVFDAVLLDVSEYEPRNIFPYFKKSLQRYINVNAEWLLKQVKQGELQ